MTGVQPAAAVLGPTSCAGAAIDPTQVFTGEFSAEQQGSFILLPFSVPVGTTAVRVKYCWDPPISLFTKHTLDLGLYEARDRRASCTARTSFAAGAAPVTRT